jgi:hypothetical protein
MSHLLLTGGLGQRDGLELRRVMVRAVAVTASGQPTGLPFGIQARSSMSPIA